MGLPTLMTVMSQHTFISDPKEQRKLQTFLSQSQGVAKNLNSQQREQVYEFVFFVIPLREFNHEGDRTENNDTQISG